MSSKCSENQRALLRDVAGLPIGVLPSEVSGSDDASMAHRLAMAGALATERYRSIERLEAEVERLHDLLRIALKEVR